MVETLLLHLLASLQLLPRLVSSAVLHPAPSFSVTPQQDEYLFGDVVNLSCSAPATKDNLREFHYYSDVGWAVTARVSNRKHTYKLNVTNPQQSGVYTCAYYTEKHGSYTKSEESHGIAIKVKDFPPAPKLTMDPLSGDVGEGHPLVLTCTAPGDAADRRFHFYHNGAQVLPEDMGSEVSTLEPIAGGMKVSSLSIPQFSVNRTGQYSCQYDEVDSGRWIPSTMSQAMTATLKDPPSPPVLSMDPPSGVVAEGLPLLLTCTAHGGPAERRFHFYKDGAELVPGDAGSDVNMAKPGTGSASVSMLSIPRTGSDSAGIFACGYEESVNGRWVLSPRSQALNVTVKEPPPQPQLHVDPPAGAVSEGLPLLITCTAPVPSGGQRFHFYKDGAEIIPGASGPELITPRPGTVLKSLSIPEAGPDAAGEFTCTYEEKVSGQWVSSPRSQAATVTVKGRASLLIPLVAGCSGVAVALILLLLLICLCKRTKKGSKWQLRTRTQNDGSISSYSPIPLASYNTDTA
ncbi:advanced glycosylation end product-specific receptor-like [Carettochelys insculpta]|uniref:advanced glycosylation end product-specific receptor-like n=1 Tax=Carettochelys insculpta TaxID=44489 RepID=UPI003EBBFF31